MKLKVDLSKSTTQDKLDAILWSLAKSPVDCEEIRNAFVCVKYQLQVLQVIILKKVSIIVLKSCKNAREYNSRIKRPDCIAISQREYDMIKETISNYEYSI